MKRFFAAILLLTMIFALASCGETKGTEATTTQTEATTTATESASAATKATTANVEEPPIPFSKHAETPTASVLIDTKQYAPYHEMAVSQIGGVIGDGYDIFKSDYLPSVDKIEFVHFCRDSEIEVVAGDDALDGVLLYNAETGERIMPEDTQLKYELAALGSLDRGRYILKFYATDRGNGAFANDYITEVFFIGIEIDETFLPQIDPKDIMVYKPVIYLYPVEPTDVTVKYVNEANLLTTYPKYDGGWRVRADARGTLTDENGRQYYALFYDEARTYSVDFSTGFYVTAEGAIPFLEEKLALLGLNEREADEFIMFWLPVLERNGQSVVYFEQTVEREAECPLDVSPAPDSVLRVVIHVKKVDAPVDIEPETLVPFERRGFTIVEWGGTTY